jgi:Peptidase_C39 like family
MASIFATQNTWLKREPKQAGLLSAEAKLFVPKGSAHRWDSITLLAGESHYKVSLSAQPKETWFFWPEHFTIVNDEKLLSAPKEKPQSPLVLTVPFYSQLDNYTDPHGTCYSSACAMMLKGLKPTSIKDDNDYLRVVLRYGKTTDPSAQLKALGYFGVDAAFLKTGNWSDVKALLKAGVPVPLGILHKGRVTSPVGGGHWITAVGVWTNYQGLVVHDPYGELDLVSGTYGKKDGAYLRYSLKNLGPRWMVEGSGSGWYIKALNW